jgi:rare lipoprotein A
MKTLFLSIVLALVIGAVCPAFASAGFLSVARAELGATQVGVGSWYGSDFMGGRTASGEIYRREDKTAAHRSLPFGTWIRVTDLRSGRNTVVRVNNRGPFIKGRVVDLSHAAAAELGIARRGVAKVKLEVLRPPDGRKLLFDTWYQPLVATR